MPQSDTPLFPDPSLVEKGPDVPCQICGRVLRKFFAKDATCNDPGDRVCMGLAFAQLMPVLKDILVNLQAISRKVEKVPPTVC